MLISQSKNFLFVHIQKTAGRSFDAVLKSHIPDLEDLCGTHDHAVNAKELLSDEWSDYYKVALVQGFGEVSAAVVPLFQCPQDLRHPVGMAKGHDTSSESGPCETGSGSPGSRCKFHQPVQLRRAYLVILPEALVGGVHE